MAESYQEKIEQIKEQAYQRGKRAVAMTILGELRPYFQQGSNETREIIAETQLHQTRLALRSLFRDLEIEWPGDDLHLADVVEKHLAKVLAE